MNNDITDQIQESYRKKREEKQRNEESTSKENKDEQLSRLILEAAKAQIKHRDSHEPKVEVKNFPDITSDIDKVSEAVDGLTVAMHTQSEENVEIISIGLQEVSDRIAELPKELVMQPVVNAVEQVVQAVGKVKFESGSKDVVAALKKLEKQISSLKLSPTIEVAPTPITIPKIDLSPLRAEIAKLKVEEGIELSDYRAQNLDEQIDGIQYVLMLHSTGAWYIIRNDESENTLRYYFGNGDYTQTWENLDQLTYNYLDKAIHEAQA